MRTQFSSTDQYIGSFPAATRKLLRELRALIREAAPDANEKISYGIPTFAQNGTLVHFAAFANHLGLYGAPGAPASLERKLQKYRTGKGTLRFSLDQPIPANLVRQLVTFAVKRNAAKRTKR
jgi:uncharacterized protein YdhG (YjbR/CyaY superfamily)